ncbi:serine hydrolase domain-containing protein [Pseudoduganella chitinolytica]|uniref:Serine hydrolase n=1 Tax=Pseudoduganella chitinolytica TaxID=34070 RepID=A0ABY8B6D5_9BURK|nr:serine hydrolase domain-containing protein [Pseudoduganella chitinolytica]WEF31360.1 serine hydrolase [Pseudoduganella chitinolytica]
MKNLFILCALLLGALPAHAAPSLSQPIAELLREEGLDGVVWTTLDATGAAGVSHARTGAPMHPGQRVHVGSIAKTLVAVGILRLASERRLALDTPVSAILPGIRFDNPWEAADPVRLRHLLDHTSGLDDVRFWHVFSERARADTPLAEAFPPGQGLLRVRCRPGSRTSYSNLGYTLLGMVIEAVTGQRYERYLDTGLLLPLNLRDSTFAFVSQHDDKRLAMGHFEEGVPQAAMASFVRPAGQFTTTAADMGRLARFLMGDGKVDGRDFIDPALLRQMGEPAGTEAARAGLAVGYALGLRKLDRHGAVARCHGGNGVGFRALLCLFPETQQAFFYAINTDSETANYQRIDAFFTRALALPPPPPARPASPALDAGPWLGVYVPSPNRFGTMLLADTLFSFVRLTGDDGGLQLRPFQGKTVALAPVGSGLLQAPDKLLPSHALFASAAGDRILTNGTQTYEQVPLARLLALWASVAAGVLGLAFLLVGGGVRLAARRLSRHDPLLAPFAGIAALLLPLPLLYRQPSMQLGDVTAASVLLAIVTALLPVALCIGLGLSMRRRRLGADALAMAAALQLTVLLAVWGLLPLRLWA